MAPAMKSKAMKVMKAKSVKALTKGGICDSLAVSTALKKKERDALKEKDAAMPHWEKIEF